MFLIQTIQIVIFNFESSSNVYMFNEESDETEQMELNQSKFMTEQVNWDEQPTEQEIIQKAQQLDIDDYKLAKEALVKELDPQWRPYLNRYGQVYYINLEQKKGFVDHPIDMEYKITYALKYKKKIPHFKQYTLQQISQDTRTIMREVYEYQRQKGLNIVYEQSDQQSVRKKTLRSNEEDEQIQIKQLANAEIQRQVNQNRLEIQREIKRQLSQYRKEKENLYKNRVKQHQDYIIELKKARLKDINDVYSQQIEEKNKINYQKMIQSTVSELQIKKIKYEETLGREMDLVLQLQTYQNNEINFKRLYKQRLINKKRKKRDEIFAKINAYTTKRIIQELYREQKQFYKGLQLLTSSKINYQQIMDKNLQKLNRQPQLKIKKRYSMFYPETFHKQNQIVGKQIQTNFKIKIEHQQVWQNKTFDEKFISKAKPSLSLRLLKRIL